MKIEAKTKEEYIRRAGERGQIIAELDEYILKNAPDVTPVMSGSGMYGSMLAYGMMPYNSKDYKEWPLIMLGVQKHHISLYICAVEKGTYIAEKYQNKLGRVSVGKSCIRFKKIEDLNLDTLSLILADLNKKYKKGEKLFL